ncbi:unnamed protein product [Medioppia subpectinata]|uniref:Cuticle protein n=1 Tax=Medioppia subpectinata TaxID=1979941 RepID=A0A7R9L327_9ACAR|nr:unnamed protein product [Medioppia subpectinata]CAG2114379.1 unnamed protein product [Medioppia subpectinata]
MFKLTALLALIACSSAQVLRFSPLTLGSTNAAELQTIQLTAPQRLAVGRPAIQPIHAIRAAPAIHAAPAFHAAPQPIAIAASPFARQAVLARPAIHHAINPIAVREEHHAPEPYTYAFTSVDEFGTQLGRQEQADGSGTVTGSYSLSDPDGRQRVVEYIADAAGFRATVRTNEPGTANANPADVQIHSTAPNRR